MECRPLHDKLCLNINKLPLSVDTIDIIKSYLINPIKKDIHDKNKGRYYEYEKRQLICERIINNKTTKTTSIHENLCCNEFKICVTTRFDNNLFTLVNVHWGREKLLSLYKHSLLVSNEYSSLSIYSRMNYLNNYMIFNSIAYVMFQKMCYELPTDKLEQIYRWYILHYP